MKGQTRKGGTVCFDVYEGARLCSGDAAVADGVALHKLLHRERAQDTCTGMFTISLSGGQGRGGASVNGHMHPQGLQSCQSGPAPSEPTPTPATPVPAHMATATATLVSVSFLRPCPHFHPHPNPYLHFHLHLHLHRPDLYFPMQMKMRIGVWIRMGMGTSFRCIDGTCPFASERSTFNAARPAPIRSHPY